MAADYYRTVRQWDEFEKMMRRIEKINPQSNGLVFLKGAAAFQRDGELELAEAYYLEALERDPDFVRAQAHLVFMQTDVSRIREELKKLQSINPEHQIVHWAGPAVELAFADWQLWG